MSKAQLIKTVIEGSVINLMGYDRKEDEDLPLGAIEEALENGDITVDEMIAAFGFQLKDYLEVFSDVEFTR